MKDRSLPLKIVAWLFIVAGIEAVVSIVGKLVLEGGIDLNIGLLGLWIGPGLLRRDPKYRTWALRVLALGLILEAIAAAIFTVQPAPYVVRSFGRQIGSVSSPVALAAILAIVALTLWQVAVLRAPSVRAQFDVKSPPA